MDNGEELALLSTKSETTHVVARCGGSQLCFYGLGHVFNDLCAAVWFSYTLFYFQIVLEMESTTAGTLVMLGECIQNIPRNSSETIKTYYVY